jgi:hypothetical protein
MDFEANHNTNFGGHDYSERSSLAVNTYLWENVGEDASVSFACVQIGSIVYFHSRENEILSTNIVGKVDLQIGRTTDFDFTTVDGDLIIATGKRILNRVSYSETLGFELEEFTLKVRDTWGCEDVLEGEDLNNGAGVSYRPSSISAPHLYNLRNQGWATPRSIAAPGGAYNGDPLTEVNAWEYSGVPYGKWPSNADMQHEWVRPDPESDSQDRRFFVEDFHENPPSNVEAAKGYFIIDPLMRGQSRTNEYEKNESKYDEVERLYRPLPSTLPEDRTTGGATYVEEYAGRVWYSGFGAGGVVGGDKESPKLTGYVMYSQLVDNPADLPKCYQEGDPTDPDTSDLVDTDGGVLRIAGMGQVISMKAVRRGLFVIATNGIWMISGGLDSGFTATNIEVNKISEVTPSAKHSIIEVEGTLMFWADEGIYHVTPTETGAWTVTNITQDTIQSYYTSIDFNEKLGVKSYYDPFERQVRWLFSKGRAYNMDVMEELVLDLNVGGFYPLRIENPRVVDGIDRPFVRDYMEARPFTRTLEEDPVVTSDTLATGGGEIIVLQEEVITDVASVPTLKFLTFWYPEPRDDDDFLFYSFAEYNNASWLDWGVRDAAAHMVTGANTQGDSSRDKMTPYLTFHMEKGGRCPEDGSPPVGELPAECEPQVCDAVEASITTDGNVWHWPLFDPTDSNIVPAVWDKAANAPLSQPDLQNSAPNAITGTDIYASGFGNLRRIALPDTGYDACRESPLIPYHVRDSGYGAPTWGGNPAFEQYSGSIGPGTSETTFQVASAAAIVHDVGWYQSQTCYIFRGGGVRIYRNHLGSLLGQSRSFDVRMVRSDVGGMNDRIEFIFSAGTSTILTTLDPLYFNSGVPRNIGVLVQGTGIRHVNIGPSEGKIAYECRMDYKVYLTLGDTTTEYTVLDEPIATTWSTVDAASPLDEDLTYWQIGGGGTYNIFNGFQGKIHSISVGDPVGITSDEWSDVLASYHRSYTGYTPPDYCSDETAVTGGCEDTDVASSCLVRTGWDHAYSTDTGRLSRQFQVYREVRHQDGDYSVVTTRNRVRGRGGSYFMRMDTEPGKDCRILGWNLALQGNAYV